MEGLTEGRIVHYVVKPGVHRPAIVVNVWQVSGCDGYSNLMLFTDGPNDWEYWENSNGVIDDPELKAAIKRGQVWLTSVCYDEHKTPGTWHWIERAGEAKPVQLIVDWEALARSAYHAYGAVTDHKNYQGLPMPTWEALTEKIQLAWVGAAKDVYEKAKSG